MKNGSQVSITGAVIGALATACGGIPTDYTSSPQAPSDPTHGMLEANASTEASSAEPESPYLFRDPSTSGPRLDVFDADGNIGVSVGGPIGTENDVLPKLRPDGSLVELYQALHPTESEVPSDLEALDELVTPLLRDLVASAPTEAPPAAVTEKSQSAFMSTLCKDFVEGSARYIDVVCRWFPSTDTVLVVVDDTIKSGDRVYGWNNASSAAQINFTASGAPVFSSTLAPFTWRAAWMTGGGPYDASITAPSSLKGERGGTHHMLFTIIR